MSDVNIAAAAVASKQAQTQMAIAAKIAKFNHASESAVADLVEAASQNLQKMVAATPPGVGANLDISA